eukprot:COSAG03_NODE_376_length_8389_cov_5.712666_3_plen_855_part_00
MSTPGASPPIIPRSGPMDPHTRPAPEGEDVATRSASIPPLHSSAESGLVLPSGVTRSVDIHKLASPPSLPLSTVPSPVRSRSPPESSSQSGEAMVDAIPGLSVSPVAMKTAARMQSARGVNGAAAPTAAAAAATAAAAAAAAPRQRDPVNELSQLFPQVSTGDLRVALVAARGDVQEAYYIIEESQTPAVDDTQQPARQAPPKNRPRKEKPRVVPKRAPPSNGLSQCGSSSSERFSVHEETEKDGTRFGVWTKSKANSKDGSVVWEDTLGRFVEQQAMLSEEAEKLKCQEDGHNVLGVSTAAAAAIPDLYVKAIPPGDPRGLTGAGAFAARDMAAGTVVGIYGGMLRADDGCLAGYRHGRNRSADGSSLESLENPLSEMEELGAHNLAMDYAFDLLFSDGSKCEILPFNRIGALSIMAINEQGYQGDDQSNNGQRLHQYTANCDYFSFKHLSVPYHGVKLTRSVAKDEELLSKKYGREYWEGRKAATGMLKHWPNSTPDRLKQNFQCGLETRKQEEQHCVTSGSHYLVPDRKLRAKIEAMRQKKRETLASGYHCVLQQFSGVDKEIKPGLARYFNLRPGCATCGQDTDPGKQLLCDKCQQGYHTYCLDPPLAEVPAEEWLCPSCIGKEPSGAAMAAVARSNANTANAASTQPRTKRQRTAVAPPAQPLVQPPVVVTVPTVGPDLPVLTLAVFKQNLKEVKRLLSDPSVDVTAYDRDGDNCLMVALTEARWTVAIDIVSAILTKNPALAKSVSCAYTSKEGVPVDCRHSTLIVLVQGAAFRDRHADTSRAITLAEKLLDAGADPVYQDSDGGWTFLHWAVDLGNSKSVKTTRAQQKRTKEFLSAIFQHKRLLGRG